MVMQTLDNGKNNAKPKGNKIYFAIVLSPVSLFQMLCHKYVHQIIKIENIFLIDFEGSLPGFNALLNKCRPDRPTRE